MPKKRRRAPRKREEGLELDEDASDNDNVYDVVDRFHINQDADLLTAPGAWRRRKAEKEILSVNVDDEESEEEEEFEDELDDTAINTESMFLASGGTVSNSWGKKRQNFYGTSYVDKDFGGVQDSDEAEMLELEEEDAIARQKKMETANACVDLDDFNAGPSDGDESSEGPQARAAFLTLDEAIVGCGTPTIRHKEEGTTKHLFKALEKEQNTAKQVPEARPLLRTKQPAPAMPESIEDAPQRRRITYEMMKNRGIVISNGKRRSTHARVKNRRQFSKALIRRRSQVPDVIREVVKYDGEKRGIRSATIRSVKLS